MFHLSKYYIAITSYYNLEGEKEHTRHFVTKENGSLGFLIWKMLHTFIHRQRVCDVTLYPANEDGEICKDALVSQISVLSKIKLYALAKEFVTKENEGRWFDEDGYQRQIAIEADKIYRASWY